MTEEHKTTDEKDQSWFERPGNIRLMIVGLVIACVLLVLADTMYSKDHAHFSLEKVFALQAWFGFAAFVIVVFIGKFLRLIIKRDEDYYDR